MTGPGSLEPLHVEPLRGGLLAAAQLGDQRNGVISGAVGRPDRLEVSTRPEVAEVVRLRAAEPPAPGDDDLHLGLRLEGEFHVEQTPCSDPVRRGEARDRGSERRYEGAITAVGRTVGVGRDELEVVLRARLQIGDVRRYGLGLWDVAVGARWTDSGWARDDRADRGGLAIAG